MEKVRLFDRSHDYESFEPGERIFEAGDEGSEMYVVLEGTVAIGSDDVVVDTVTAGGIFGEMALVLDQPRGATVAALSELEVFELDMDLGNHHHLGRADDIGELGIYFRVQVLEFNLQPRSPCFTEIDERQV